MYSTEAWGKLSKEANFSKFQIQRNVPGDDDVQFEVYLIIAYPYQLKKSVMLWTVEDVDSKLVDVTSFADADSEERVDNWLVTADSLGTACHVRQQLDKSFLTSTFSFQYFLSELSLFIACLYLI